MNILQTITAQREKLDEKVNAAIAERDGFIASISETLGQSLTRKRGGHRRLMSPAQ